MQPGWRRANARSRRVQRSQLDVERVDHRQRDRDLLARGGGQRLRRQPRPPVERQQLAALRAAVVIQHRLDALLPLAALMRQRVTQPDLSAEIEQMIGRDPGLRQPSDRQQLANVPRVSAIALSALLVPSTSGGLGRLGQMHHRADLPQLIGDKPPAGRRLQRDLELLAAEPLTEPPDALRDAPARSATA